MKSTSQQEEFGAEFGALGLEALMPSTELSLCGSPGSSGAQGTFRTGKRCGGFGGWGLRTRLLRNLQKATGGSALASGPNNCAVPFSNIRVRAPSGNPLGWEVPMPHQVHEE